MNQPIENEYQGTGQKWLIIAAGVGCGGMVLAAVICCGVVGMVRTLSPSARQQLNHERQSFNQGERHDEFTPKPAPTVDSTLVTKLRSGMAGDEVRAILGNPHKEDRHEIPAIPALDEPAKTHVTWTYNPDSDGFIVLLFEDGILCDGGTGGYNINTGLVVPNELKRIFEDSKRRR